MGIAKKYMRKPAKIYGCQREGIKSGLQVFYFFKQTFR